MDSEQNNKTSYAWYHSSLILHTSIGSSTGRPDVDIQEVCSLNQQFEQLAHQNKHSYQLETLLNTSLYICIDLPFKRLHTHAPYLIQQTSIAPHITGSS